VVGQKQRMTERFSGRRGVATTGQSGRTQSLSLAEQYCCRLQHCAIGLGHSFTTDGSSSEKWSRCSLGLPVRN